MDFFLLKRVGWNVIFMAFIMVLGAALLLIPFMLYALGMASRGWDAVYVALFGTMIGSTDAASVIAILKSGGAPELLSIILEGESLFNDASSLTMFEIFSEVIIHEQNLARDIGAIAWKTVTSFLGGFAIGSTTALFMALMVKWLQLRDMKGYIETALSLALAYIAYYITQIWVECSGVIAVVIFGLWGSATVQWGMNSKNLSKGLFLGFYDVFVCILNGIIFFFVGASIINLVIRSQNFLQLGGNETTSQFYAGLAWRFAAIYGANSDHKTCFISQSHAVLSPKP
jgi:NhaP-type Na+/H+ or K+/H+ antiporter